MPMLNQRLCKAQVKDREDKINIASQSRRHLSIISKDEQVIAKWTKGGENIPADEMA